MALSHFPLAFSVWTPFRLEFKHFATSSCLLTNSMVAVSDEQKNTIDYGCIGILLQRLETLHLFCRNCEFKYKLWSAYINFQRVNAFEIEEGTKFSCCPGKELSWWPSVFLSIYHKFCLCDNNQSFRGLEIIFWYFDNFERHSYFCRGCDRFICIPTFYALTEQKIGCDFQIGCATIISINSCLLTRSKFRRKKCNKDRL